MKRRMILSGLLLVFVLLLCGCGSQTVADMYSLPKRSPEFQHLQSVIDAHMDGLEYSAPVAGENRPPVQTSDLDGDGREEYLVFTKGVGEQPLQILIFRQVSDDEYTFLESIPFKGAEFEQIWYVDMDGEPGNELVVGRRINDQVTRIVSIHSFASGQSQQIKSTIYTRFTICDLNNDGLADLMVIRSGEEEAGNAVAVLYTCEKGTMEGSMETGLSVRADRIRRMTTSRLSSGEPAVYVAGSWYDIAVITDVFAIRKGVFTNISLSNEMGTSVQTLRNYFVYAEDIDSDGVLELPGLLPMRFSTGPADSREDHLIRWYSVDINAEETDKLYTYHNYGGGWYLTVQEQWLSKISVQKHDSEQRFFMWNEKHGELVPVFTVFTLTGKDRDSEAAEGNRFALYRGENVVYAAKLESASALYGITEAYLKENFHLIGQAGNNAEG